MKKLLLILLCVPLIFSCGEKEEKDKIKKELSEEKLQTIDTTYANGDKYVGERRYSRNHGQGTYTFADGEKYVGEYKDGKKHGQGTFTFTNGTIEEGLFENGRFLGE